jgi:ubiquinol-cytochrome c reductase cytochrome b subunit
VTIALLLLPFLDRARSRKASDRWKVLTFVGLLMAGLTALTAIAIVEDGRNETYQHGLAAAEKDAARARKLALEGVPPAGGVAVYDNDPLERTRKLFRENCGTCHTIEGKGGEEAPSLDDYGTRAWLTALVRDPRSKRFYGGTKGHTTMEAVPPEKASDEQLAAIVEYMIGLAGPEVGAVDAALVAKGKELWASDTFDCSGCHEVEAGKAGTGPTLAGRGTAAWVARVIANSGEPDLYGDTAEMPKFAGKLSPAEIEALAQFVTMARK